MDILHAYCKEEFIVWMTNTSDHLTEPRNIFLSLDCTDVTDSQGG